MEGICPDGLKTRRQGHRFQRRTVFKCVAVYRCYRIRQRDFCQTRIAECVFPNRLQSIRQGDARQIWQVAESIGADGCHAFLYDNGRDLVLVDFPGTNIIRCPTGPADGQNSCRFVKAPLDIGPFVSPVMCKGLERESNRRIVIKGVNDSQSIDDVPDRLCHRDAFQLRAYGSFRFVFVRAVLIRDGIIPAIGQPLHIECAYDSFHEAGIAGNDIIGRGILAFCSFHVCAQLVINFYFELNRDLCSELIRYATTIAFRFINSRRCQGVAGFFIQFAPFIFVFIPDVPPVAYSVKFIPAYCNFQESRSPRYNRRN